MKLRVESFLTPGDMRPVVLLQIEGQLVQLSPERAEEFAVLLFQAAAGSSALSTAVKTIGEIAGLDPAHVALTMEAHLNRQEKQTG